MNAIFEWITEFILGGFFVEFFWKIITRLFRIIQLIGIMALKMLTFSSASISELKEKYKDSSKTYFLGFAIVFGLGYLITTLAL